MSLNTNAVVYFEIPVNNLPRAADFYKRIFGFVFDTEHFDGNDMAYFPFKDQVRGITGALAQGATYRPSHNGTLVYFNTSNMESCIELLKAEGAPLLYPPVYHYDLGFAVAEFEDSEGNRIGLHQLLDNT